MSGVNKAIIIGRLGKDPEVRRIYERWHGKVSVDDESGCWNWMGAKSRGYGLLAKGRRKSPWKAHRLAVFFSTGEMPKGAVCHKCDNPSCVNPDHLFVGTQKDNLRDASRKNRLNAKSLLNLRPGAKGFYGAGPTSNQEAIANG